MTIEELEIIIKANITDAINGLKKFTKEIKTTIENSCEPMKEITNQAKNMSDSISNDFKQLNKSGKLTEFNKEIKNSQNELRKIIVNLQNGEKFSFNPEINGDFETKLLEAQKLMNQELNNEVVITPKFDNDEINKYLSQMQKYGKNWNDGKSSSTKNEEQPSQFQGNVANFDYLTISDEIKTIATQITQLTPQLKAFGDEAKKIFTEQGRLIPEVVQKIREFGVGISYIKGQITQSFNPLTKKLEELSGKISPVTSIFSNIGKVAKNSIIQISSNFKELANSTNNPIGKINLLIKKIKNIGDENEKVKIKGSNFGIVFGKSLEKGITSIKKFVLSLLSIRSAFNLISKAAQSYLSFDTSLNDSLQNSWNTLGSLLAPALEYVVGLFSKLTSAVALLIKSLTGIDLVARANTKSLEKQTKATKNASQSLSGIDDIDTLSTSSTSESSNENSSITIESIDITPLEEFFNKAKEIFSIIFQPFKDAWESVGVEVIDSAVGMFSELGILCSSVFSSLFEVMTNGTVTEMLTNIFTIWQNLFNIVGAVASTISTAWNNNNKGTETVQNIFNGFNNLLSIVSLFFQTFKEKWDELGQPICDIFMGIINDLSKHFENLTIKFKEIWDNGGKFLFEKLIELGSKIIEIAGWIYDNFVSPFIGWFIDKIVPAISPLLNALGNIIDIGMNVVDFFKNVFTGNWGDAWKNIQNIIGGVWDFVKNIFSAGGQIFEGIVTGIANIFKEIINAIIRGINGVIRIPFDAINGILNGIKNFDIPIVGKAFYGLWGWNPLPVPQIPQLAKGTVADEPTLAEIGEYSNAKSNPEIVSPISIMDKTFRNALSEFEFEGTRIDTLRIDVAGDNFYDGAIDYINDKSIRKGVSVIKEV